MAATNVPGGSSRVYDATDPQKNTPGSHPAGSVPALDPNVYNPDGTLKNPQPQDEAQRQPGGQPRTTGNTAGQPNTGQQNAGGPSNPTATGPDVSTSQDPNAPEHQQQSQKS